MPESINADHELVVVASGMDQSTEQIVDYVRGYGVPINVLFFEYLLDGEREYLARSWLTDPEQAVAPGSGSGKKQPPWSGRDFFVAIGENNHRNWDDMRRFGFVSAGHGEKYRRAMSNLFEGARVFAAIPGTGYVGVGEVIEPAVAVSDFLVELDGQRCRSCRCRTSKHRIWAKTLRTQSRPSTLRESGGWTHGPATRPSGRRECSPTRTLSPSCASPSPCRDSGRPSTSIPPASTDRGGGARQRPHCIRSIYGGKLAYTPVH